MPVIASIILLDLIVAAVGGGSLILAWRLRQLLHISLMISAASPSKLLSANGSVAALTVSVITDEARDGPDAAIRAAHRSLRDLSRFSPQFDWNFSREALDPIFS